MQKISNKYTFFILMLISLSAFSTEKIQSILGDERIISPEQAFKFNYFVNNNTLKLIWEIESGYYMYKDSFALISDKQISPINIDKIKWIVKDDPFLGIKKVIYNKVEIEYDVGPSLSRLSSQKISMNVEYQGCKENTYCYPIKSTVIFL
tara:strand:+ start:7864 stop:8313 length:450 start_codon:yes stop_codon:yes gene_type:complete